MELRLVGSVCSVVCLLVWDSGVECWVLEALMSLLDVSSVLSSMSSRLSELLLMVSRGGSEVGELFRAGKEAGRSE